MKEGGGVEIGIQEKNDRGCDTARRKIVMAAPTQPTSEEEAMVRVCGAKARTNMDTSKAENSDTSRKLIGFWAKG